ncbi:MAG: SDR family oxidoreductase [Planctomycetes bacterium]|nr:SDR family oxidoreductase [Planctomycetota bacterium]
MPAYLQDKVVVITGGGRGIGLGLAHAFAAAGSTIAVLDINPDAAHAAVASLPGSRHLAIPLDVSDESAVNSAALRINADLRGPDVLINNAGVYARGHAATLPLADLHWVHAVNFWGAVHCTRAFLPRLAARPRAHIVNILSEFAHLGFPAKAAYCSSKAALRAFGDCLRHECPRSITVLEAIPPAINTGLVRDARASDSATLKLEADMLAAHALPVERFARAVVRAVERRRERLAVGAFTRGLLLANRLSPRATAALTAWAARRMGVA